MKSHWMKTSLATPSGRVMASGPAMKEAQQARRGGDAVALPRLCARACALTQGVLILALAVVAHNSFAYERLQGPTELTYWDRAQTYNGYTFFGAQGTTYLIDMEGRVTHTWPLGINPRLLDNGNVLDATGSDISAFTGFREVDWSGSNVWQYTETRTGYFPHHDFLRIYNKKLGAATTLYLANKTITSSQCIAAGCTTANGNYTNVTVDAIVEVDAAGTVVWEWCFFDHGIQDYDAGKANYVGAGKSVSNYAGRIDLNLPGRPLTNDWLHCVALDYNTNLDQIAVTAAGGEFYVVDHGGTFAAGNPTASIALAASTNGDFIYRFGDPARYGQGSPPSITMNWTVSTTGNKQIGAVSQAAWIPPGLPGSGHFLVFNNGADLFETTPQSYLVEVNGYLNAGGNDTGAYVNPPDAGYTIWSPPGHDTDKQKKNMSRQIVSTFYSMANQAFFSHTGGSAQRLANSNTLVCAATEGHIFEATATGEVVWEYINPVTTNGVVAYKRDGWPLANPVWRACRYSATDPALSGRTLIGTNTIAGVAPSYISAPSISGVTQTPASPYATNTVLVTATITNNQAVTSASLTYMVGAASNSIAMTNSGTLYSASIPAFSAGTLVSYFVSAADAFDNTAIDTPHTYTVQHGSLTNSPPWIGSVTQSPTVPTSVDPVTITAQVTDDVAVASVILSYITGTGGSVTNTVFAEMMATNAVKPWTGAGCDNAWTVTGNYCEQRTQANCGAGNPCGMEYKGGPTTNALTAAMIATSNAINAVGMSGYVEFCLQALTLDGTDGWTFQLDSGSGYVTRLGELTGASHGWQTNHYDLAGADLVSGLKMRFQFTGGGPGDDDRIDLDRIFVRTVTIGGVPSNVTMTLVSNGVYAAQIPAQTAGTTVRYYVIAADSDGASTWSPAGAPASTYAYTVSAATNIMPAVSFTGQFVRIPGGSYVMGDHFGYVDPDHPSDELPLHTAYISPLYMATTLVTCREYCDYLNDGLNQGLIEVRSNVVYAVGGSNIYFYTYGGSVYSRIQYTGTGFVVLDSRDLHPVTSMLWHGAIAYCNWLSQRDGFTPCYDLSTGDVAFTNNGFRLPTEAEWEYCAHGGLTNPYCMFPWGTNSNPDGTYANWEGSGDPFEMGVYPYTTPVGFYNGALRYKSDYKWPGSQTSYQTSDGSNPFGLYDMAGSVWEWVNDWYASGYYAYCVSNNIVTNPPGPTTGDIFADHGGIAYRGMRGGTWYNGGGQTNFGYARVSNRDPSWSRGPSPDGNDISTWFQVGFRVMRPERLTQTVGLFLNATNAFPGYTLMSPMQSTNTYLLNNAGQYVHKWTSQYPPGRADYLLSNGHLMRECSAHSIISTGGGEGGRHEEHDWAGNLVWAFDLNTATNMSHHDFKVLPNGNLIMIVCEVKTTAEVLAAGFNPAILDTSITTSGGFMLPDYVAEVQPTRPYGGIIVWEWHAWDHLIQDFDSSKNNYGVVSNHVELINPNGTGMMIQQFWNHMNAIDYNPQLDQIVLSVRGNSELWVIDHQLTTAQAAGHTGGRYNKGGDLLYRWGNPAQYKLASQANQMLWQQHDVQWIATNCPGAGHLLIHDNGIGRGYTSIDEVVPPVDSAGNYTRLAGTAFSPSSLYWTYQASPPTNYYSSEISGAQRLPNGNTLICGGIFGKLFEVTTNGQTVWLYLNPETTVPLSQGTPIPADAHMSGQWFNEVFKVHRYPTNYAGLFGKDLTPRGTVEPYTGAATDTVGLGLPDVWVRAHFGSLSAVTASSSHSTNGLTDILEYQYGLDPTVWSSANDGIPDGWAIAYGFDPTLASVATLTNTNGFTTLQSYIADLDPTNPDSQLAIIGIASTNNGVQLTWVGGSNAWQYLDCASMLTTNQWSAIFTNVPPTSITNSVIHTGAAASTNLFYRVRAGR